MYQKDNIKIKTTEALEVSQANGQHVESIGFEYVSGDILMETYGKHFFIVRNRKFLGNKVKIWENGIIFETTKGLEAFFKQPVPNKMHIRWGSTALEQG